jgi:hypothetical protein
MRVLRGEEEPRTMLEEPPEQENTAAESEGRIKVGIAMLDDILNGGIPEGYSVVLTSLSCDEKDVLLQQFLGKAVDDGKIAIYICVDPLKVQLTSEYEPKNLYILACSSRAEVLPQGQTNMRSIKGL